MFYELLAIVFVGIGHLYLFHLLLGHQRISGRYIVFTSLLFTLFLVIVITVTGFIELNMIAILLFLVIIGRLYRQHSLAQVVYMALLSIVVFTVVKNGLIYIVHLTYLESPFPYYIWTLSVINFSVLAVLVICMYLFRRTIQTAGMYMLQSVFYKLTYAVVVICALLLTIVNFPTLTFLAALNTKYGELFYVVLLLGVIALLLMLTLRMYVLKERLVVQHEKTEYEQLMAYIEKLEFLHDELATFRHDYTNLLLSLEQSIAQKKLEQIEQIYKSAVAPTISFMNMQQLELTKLARVEVPALKSILSVKILAAQRQGITVSLDVPEPILMLALPADAFIRLLTVFVDNAIEEAAKSETKLMQIALFETEGHQQLIVKNSVEQAPDLTKLYEKHFSTKGEKRGLGLFSVQRLLKKHDEATLVTKMEASYFIQQLIIKNATVQA